jgi:hypothetical protein
MVTMTAYENGFPFNEGNSPKVSNKYTKVSPRHKPTFLLGKEKSVCADVKQNSTYQLSYNCSFIIQLTKHETEHNNTIAFWESDFL